MYYTKISEMMQTTMTKAKGNVSLSLGLPIAGACVFLSTATSVHSVQALLLRGGNVGKFTMIDDHEGNDSDPMDLNVHLLGLDAPLFAPAPAAAATAAAPAETVAPAQAGVSWAAAVGQAIEDGTAIDEQEQATDAPLAPAFRDLTWREGRMM